jgi:hypothetical protein
MMRNRRALLTALAVDNFGSGLFLPLSLLYVTRVVRLPLATAGTVVALGTLAGLAVSEPVPPSQPPPCAGWPAACPPVPCVPARLPRRRLRCADAAHLVRF